MNNILEVISSAIQDTLERLNLADIGIDSKFLLDSFYEMLGQRECENKPDFACCVCIDDIPTLVENVISSLPLEKAFPKYSDEWKTSMQQTFSDVFSSFMKTKPFNFISPIYFDDDHLQQWYAELYPSEFLTEKLKKIILTKKPNYSLHKDKLPEFYASYDLIKGTVSILGRCTIENYPKRFIETMPIPLASREADLLVCCIENTCRQQHSGKDCLAVLNEERQRVGMAPLKQTIVGKLRFTQNIDTTGTYCNTIEPFLER